MRSEYEDVLGHPRHVEDERRIRDRTDRFDAITCQSRHDPNTETSEFIVVPSESSDA